MAVFIYLFARYHERIKSQQVGLYKKFQKQLLSATIDTQEAERMRIASTLHDDVGPLLSMAGFYLGIQVTEETSREDRIAMLDEAQNLVTTSIERVRDITQDLTPHGLEIKGLCGALTATLHRVRKPKGLKVSICFDDVEIELSQEQELMIYRVAQEVIYNIAKHSKASFIAVEQYLAGDQYIVEIKHDGQGLEQPDFERLRKEPACMGLKSITGRLQAGGGQILYAREENDYTTLIIVQDQIETEPSDLINP